jgi:hypothetical protein
VIIAVGKEQPECVGVVVPEWNTNTQKKGQTYLTYIKKINLGTWLLMQIREESTKAR